jgi:light-regulated signal transduction histidine kinase (bacteriophytochrome)
MRREEREIHIHQGRVVLEMRVAMDALDRASKELDRIVALTKADGNYPVDVAEQSNRIATAHDEIQNLLQVMRLRPGRRIPA